MPRAFVSHSTTDDGFVAEMESFLRAAGFHEVFNDVHAVKPDEQFWPRIEQGIADCDTFFVVITAAATNSEWVTREVALARSLGRRVIPIWREDCPLPPDFADRDVIDFRPRTRQERRFDVSRILRYAPSQLIGRENETKLLSDAWQMTLRLEKGRPHILTFVALGGEGKTSLVAKWVAELAAEDWPGVDAAFAWSFFSQGTREQLAASSDLFLQEALTFFGDDKDKEFAASPAGAFEKGQRLARLVGQRRNLLILDGLEPLQYAPASPTPGELKDQGIAALLKGLGAANRGLCIVTTRYSLPDLRAFWQTTAPEAKLLRLSSDAGIHLLQTLGVHGAAQELASLVEDVKGHALTLTLLGGFLRRAFHGDVRQRDRVKFEKADEKMDGGRAFRTMAAYEQWLLRDGGDEGRREVAVLRLLGLFDRPADAGCLAALRRETIPGLTEPLAELADDDWEYCLSGLEAAKLLTVNRDASGALVSLDAHPHLREYFGRQIRTQQADAWRAAHQRLYEHLCATTKEGDHPTLEDLQPLYQAVAHGCQAGLHKDALRRTFLRRIERDDQRYAMHKLGALGSNLGAFACFFSSPWRDPSPAVSEAGQSFLLGAVGLHLRSLGRLTEAVEPMQAGLRLQIKREYWSGAGNEASNLCELELTLGNVSGAIEYAEQSVPYADRGDNWEDRVIRRTTLAYALQQAGRRAESETWFREAEQMQADNQPEFPFLYSVRGFYYCDLLLAAPERAAWQPGRAAGTAALLDSCRAVSERSAQTFSWAKMRVQGSLLDHALGHLTQGRAALYAAILESSGAPAGPSNVDQRRGVPLTLDAARRELETAVAGLRRAGVQEEIPRGLLTRAWCSFAEGMEHRLHDQHVQDSEYEKRAQEDLDEAWEIAERGPMKLLLAEIHLYRARLFGKVTKYPWESPAADLAAAETLINTCGYHRRDEELADAKQAILGTPER